MPLLERLDQGQTALDLALIWLTQDRQSQCSLDLRTPIIPGLTPQTSSQGFGLIVQELAIEHSQRLRRLHRRESRMAACVGLRKIEVRQNWRDQRALHVNVNAAARLLLLARLAPAG